ncbi:Fic family protein [Collinsella ihumii]|uniref:Fic family protein n=1 Tax=Collinsella ihumii TaxID=1720204 RepID=UPI0025AADFB4|nr:Fic family protein [Collinsella ihumii]MDN0055218.1 Fic family protein [Collinsella ihumii]
MDYNRICYKRDRLHAILDAIDPEALESFERSFDVEYAHNSTAIEGNTLTLVQTKAILEDGLSVGGKSLREIYEAENHRKAFNYVKEHVAKGDALTESIAKDIHMLLLENILPGGTYRNVGVRIPGAGFVPPVGEDMYAQVKEFFARLAGTADGNSIELAAWTHAEFVRIHPFVDGNGRTARMLMNYQLMLAGFLPVSVAKEQRIEYYDALEEYAVHGELSSFADMVAALEETRLEEYLAIDPSLGA